MTMQDARTPSAEAAPRELGWHKGYLSGSRPDLRVPVRRVHLTNDQDVRTMPVVLAGAQGGLGQWSWPALAAVYVLVVTPGILAFTFAQKLFYKGLMEGVVKG